LFTLKIEKFQINGYVDGETILVLLDEMDFLLQRDESVIYNLFNWSMRTGTGLCIVGISNIMDLPDRLSARVISRIKSSMIRVPFLAYTHLQVKEILMHRY
jgi:Cdc6-like AAA superfamily ATPase